MFQPNQNLYGIAIGSTNGKGPSYPHYDVRAPTSTDVNFFLGQEWVWPGNGIWFLLTLSTAGGVLTATWEQVASSSGDVLSISGTTNQVTVTPTTGNAVASLPSTVVAPGSVTATTTLTATSGNITATNGNLSLGTAGNKLLIATGANASVGTTAVMSGSPGAVTTTSTAVTTSSIILYSRDTTGGTAGQVSITAQTTGSFTLTSTAAETSTFNYLIIN